MKKNLLVRYLQDEKGQTSTEYILLVAVVAMIILKFKTTLQKNLDNITESVFRKTQTKIMSDL